MFVFHLEAGLSVTLDTDPGLSITLDIDSGPNFSLAHLPCYPRGCPFMFVLPGTTSFKGS